MLLVRRMELPAGPKPHCAALMALRASGMPLHSRRLHEALAEKLAFIYASGVSVITRLARRMHMRHITRHFRHRISARLIILLAISDKARIAATTLKAPWPIS